MYSAVPSIVRNGAEWFSSMGTEKSKGMTLYSLSGHVQRPGQFEAPLGITLRQVLDIGDAWAPDKVIVLSSSTDTIEKHIRLRNRPHESAENMVRRFRLIDAEFRRLAPLYPNTIVIDRDSKEFHERQGLVDIITMAGLPMFPEIPYFRLE